MEKNTELLVGAGIGYLIWQKFGTLICLAALIFGAILCFAPDKKDKKIEPKFPKWEQEQIIFKEKIDGVSQIKNSLERMSEEKDQTVLHTRYSRGVAWCSSADLDQVVKRISTKCGDSAATFLRETGTLSMARQGLGWSCWELMMLDELVATEEICQQGSSTSPNSQNSHKKIEPSSRTKYPTVKPKTPSPSHTTGQAPSLDITKHTIA